MKLMGTVFLALGCSLLCFGHIGAERRKTNMLQEMARAVAFMAGEIRCSLTPLPKLIRLCREKCGREGAAFFEAVEKELQRGVPLQEAWEKAAITWELPEGAGKEAAAALGAAFTHDEEAVLRNLSEAERQLKKQLEERRSARREKEKLWVTVCFSAAGLLWLTIV